MSRLEPYKIIPPAIASGGTYLFTTDSGLEYEARFARKKDNILHATVAFGVLNDEFNGEEYSVTNRGEVFKVMATMVEVVKIYLREHPNLHTVEFTGEPKEDENAEMPTQRLLLYKRYLKTIFGENWTFHLQGNRMLVKRKL